MSAWASITLIAGAVVVAVGAPLLGRWQNHGRRMGGPISRPKLLWLSITGYGWFIAAPTVAAAKVAPPVITYFLWGFVAMSAARALAQPILLGRPHHWWPTLGIVHGVLGLIWTGIGVTLFAPGPTASASWSWAFLLWIAATCALESYFALQLYAVLRRRSTSAASAWFGADGDPRFGRLNRVTAAANVPAMLFLAVCLVGLWRS